MLLLTPGNHVIPRLGLICLFLVCVVAVVGRTGLGQETSRASAPPDHKSALATDDRIQEIEVAARLEYAESAGGFYVARFDLPQLEGGRKYKIGVLVTNPYAQPIEISGTDQQFAGQKLETDVNVVLPGQTARFVIHLTARCTGTGQAMGIIDCQDDTQRKIAIRFLYTYGLTKVFQIESRRHTILISDHEPIVTDRIPIRFVGDLSIDDLELKVGPNLRDLTIELLKEEDASFINIKASRHAISGGNLLDDVAVRRRGTDEYLSVILDVKRRTNIEVYPTSLRFTPVGNQRHRYEATAIVRVKPPSDPDTDETRDDQEKPPRTKLRTPEVHVRVNDKPTRVSVKALGNRGIYRITVILDEFIDSEDTIEAKWSIQSGRERESLTAAAFFAE